MLGWRLPRAKMKDRPVASFSWVTMAAVVVALVWWALEQKGGEAGKDGAGGPAAERAGERAGEEAPAAGPAGGLAERPVEGPAVSGGYEVHRGCVLVAARNNDGDSFMVRLPEGRRAEFRLYFVDAPESAFKRYAGGETNHARIRGQAAELGGITPEQAVDVGRQAKEFTLELLEREPFTLFTRWDSPFQDQRYHALVELRERGKPRWLHELLVERGLARLKTKPADLPDGTPASRHREHLRDLERKARRAGAGAWGL